MKAWRLMMSLPQPVKGFLVVYLIAFAVVFVSVAVMSLTGQGTTNPVVQWGVGVLGLTAVILGLVLAFNFRGSARAYAAMMKAYKPMGVDYTASFFATPIAIRIFGALFAAIGISFAVTSAILAMSLS
ncbi:hypothetical protein [Arthrobacter sp. CG_A4]|uniref:hypothetical protein n=1 Tax=Arthrobacter sp. CG_A4 TaxID=3071706 RepID=UPI002DFF2FE1|nr:hypothetical protein [Arthrobacter sp. CG_A4]